MEEAIYRFLEGTPQTALLVGVIWYVFKSLGDDIKSLKTRLDDMEKATHSCQVDLVKHYVMKKEFYKEIDRLDDHEQRIIRLEAMK